MQTGSPVSGIAIIACTVCGGPTREFGIKSGYPHYRCPDCGHVFVWPFPRNFRDIYSDDYFSGASAGFGYTDYDRDKEPMIPVFEDYLDRIEAVAKRTGSLLDIGAATGFFLNLARRRGWVVKGVEASAHAAGVARAKSLDVLTGILEDCSFPPESFDAITMWDVIEHMDAPDAALAQTAELLRSGGLLAINTPDAGSLLARMLGTRWHLVVPPEHLSLFSSQSLRLSLERHGFEVLYVTRIGKRFTLQYIFQTLSHVIRPGAAQIAAWLRGKPAGLWSFSINLQDNLFLLARKH